MNDRESPMAQVSPILLLAQKLAQKPAQHPLVRASLLTLLLAAASIAAPSQLLAQLRPLGDEDVVATAEGTSACPAVAARADGSVVVLRVDGDELRSVVIAADGSLSADHLLAEG